MISEQDLLSKEKRTKYAGAPELTLVRLGPPANVQLYFDIIKRARSNISGLLNVRQTNPVDRAEGARSIKW